MGDTSLNVAIGCIVGVQNIGLGNFFGNGTGDGMVLTDEASLQSAKDTCYVNSNHTAMLYRKLVVKQITLFINTRKFAH
ncbi:hypothetical protein [Celerinatantimonas diazotrophica]|uniref:hypothetical protein n=1 Tax=Celerinatantimonas diazotrophica TaxID=412034 RepID=UPI001044A49F|nr:hypothetical protein [Celerinatantimonas diazotrophica]